MLAYWVAYFRIIIMSEFTDHLGNNSDTKFVVKNIAPRGKHISIFNVGIANQTERDLLQIPGVSEEDVRVSLLKGELLRKLKSREITITQCDIDLLQFNEEQKQFLRESGVAGGLDIGEGQLSATLQNKLSGAANISELSSIPTSGLLNGSSVFVRTLKDTFSFFGDSSLTVQENVIITGANGGQWIRANQPSRYWMHQTQYYIDPITGSDEALGTDLQHPIRTHAEFTRRIYSHNSNIETLITCYILNDITETLSVQMSAGIFGASTYIVYDGTLGTRIKHSATINTVTVAVPSTQTEYSINVVGLTWTPYIGDVCIMSSGVSIGARFVVLKDLGGGSAQISQIGAGSLDNTPVTIQSGDTFDILLLPQFGTNIALTGPSNWELIQLTIPTLNAEMAVAFIEACKITGSGLFADFNSSVTVTNSYLAGVSAFSSSYIFLGGGGSLGIVKTQTQSLIEFMDFTIVGGGVRSVNGHSGKYAVDSGWLAIFDSSQAIHLENDYILRCTNGASIWGKGSTGPKITLLPGTSFYYEDGAVPNIGGSGTDISIGGDTMLYSALPYINGKNLSRCISLTGNSGTGVGSVALTTEALSLPLIINANKQATAPGGTNLVLSLNQSGHVDGATIYIDVPANAYSGTIYVADDLKVEGATVVSGIVTDYNLASKYLIAASRLNGACVTTFRTQSITPAQPTVLSAIVNGGTPTQLVVTFSARMDIRSTAGLSLSFSAGPTHTITGIASGNGTSVVTFTCSSAFDGTEVGTFVVASNRIAQAMNGPLLTVGSTVLTLSFTASWAQPNGIHAWLGWDAAKTHYTGSNLTSLDDSVGSLTANPPATKPTKVTGIAGTTRDGFKTIAGSYLTATPAGAEITGNAWTMCGVIKVPAFSSGRAIVGGAQFANTANNEIDFIHDTSNWTILRNQAQTGTASYANTNTSLLDFMCCHDGTHVELYINGALVASNTTAATTASIGKYLIGCLADLGISFPNVDCEYGEIRIADARNSLTDATNFHAYRLAFYV
jgi:hypothetical protein